jgi:hypothetical protein
MDLKAVQVEQPLSCGNKKFDPFRLIPPFLGIMLNI